MADAGRARAIDALADARPWLGREDTGEDNYQEERSAAESGQGLPLLDYRCHIGHFRGLLGANWCCAAKLCGQ
jgi:hypothetical protein